jgi:HAD superfamily hydrolase (TIGR01509 family)
MILIPDNAKALIFDCDGTLIDSMPLHLEAWKEAFKFFDSPFDEELVFSSRGMKEKDIVELVNKKYKLNIQAEELIKYKHEYFRKNLKMLEPIVPVIEIVHKYKNKLPMAVVSGGVREIINAELNHLSIKDLFQIIMTADDPFKAKPSPDLFLHTAKMLNVEPNVCVVFEDGELGIEAAVNAGMMIVDVRKYI